MVKFKLKGLFYLLIINVHCSLMLSLIKKVKNTYTVKQIDTQMNKISLYVKTVLCACQVKWEIKLHVFEPGKSIKIWWKLEENKIEKK